MRNMQRLLLCQKGTTGESPMLPFNYWKVLQSINGKWIQGKKLSSATLQLPSLSSWCTSLYSTSFRWFLCCLPSLFLPPLAPIFVVFCFAHKHSLVHSGESYWTWHISFFLKDSGIFEDIDWKSTGEFWLCTEQGQYWNSIPV